VNILVQHTKQRQPQMPDVPAAVELGRTPEDKQFLNLFVNSADVGYSIMSTPQTPPERIQILRDGFKAMLKDPVFLADVERIQAECDPMGGGELQALIRDALDVPAAVRDRMKQAVGDAQ